MNWELFWNIYCEGIVACCCFLVIESIVMAIYMRVFPIKSIEDIYNIFACLLGFSLIWFITIPYILWHYARPIVINILRIKSTQKARKGNDNV